MTPRSQGLGGGGGTQWDKEGLGLKARQLRGQESERVGNLGATGRIQSCCIWKLTH